MVIDEPETHCTITATPCRESCSGWSPTKAIYLAFWCYKLAGYQGDNTGQRRQRQERNDDDCSNSCG